MPGPAGTAGPMPDPAPMPGPGSAAGRSRAGDPAVGPEPIGGAGQAGAAVELPEPDPPEPEPPEVDDPAGTFGDGAGVDGVDGAAGLSVVEDSLVPSDVVVVDSVPVGAVVSPIRDAEPPPDLLSVL